jgi:hypothetical protein
MQLAFCKQNAIRTKQHQPDARRGSFRETGISTVAPGSGSCARAGSAESLDILRAGGRREAPGIAADISDGVDAKAAAGGGGVARHVGGREGEGVAGCVVGGGCTAVRELRAVTQPARPLLLAAREGGDLADGAWRVACLAPTKRRQAARHDFGIVRGRGHVSDVVWKHQRRRSRADAAKQKQQSRSSKAEAALRRQLCKRSQQCVLMPEKRDAALMRFNEI